MAEGDAMRNDTQYKFVNPGSTLSLIRSYQEARNVFAISLSLNLLLIVLGIIVNAIICYVMLRGKRYKRNSSNLFITHLSVVELVHRLVIFPILISFAIPASGIQSFQCKVVSFFSHVSASAIFVSLVAIAADRYQNIVHPLANLKSNRKPSLLLIVVWVYATVVSIPTVFSVKAVPASEIPEAKGMICDADCAGKKLCDIPQNSLGRFSTTLYFLLAFVIQLVVIFIFYNKIAIFLHNRGKNGMMHKVAVRSTSKAIRMLIITVLGYMISLGPRVVMAVLRSYGIFNGTSFAAMFLFHALVDFASYSSSMGNPLIYSYYNGDFRKEIVRVCRRKKDKKIASYAVTFVNCNTNN